jgi:RNA polymerase sigma factor FliA
VSAASQPVVTPGPRCYAQDDFDACVLRHLPQVRAIARKIHLHLPYQVELADLVSAGIVGLLDAIRRFDPGREASLSTFAIFRIRGAILDSLRMGDWAPRRLRQGARRIDAAREAASRALGRAPAEEEVAAALEMSLGDYQDLLREVCSLQVAAFNAPDDDRLSISLEDVPSLDPGALCQMLSRERDQRLLRAVRSLPTREREVIVSYYVDGRSLKATGQRLGVSESRVCQIHAAALQRLRRILRADAV